jgi:signal transduction histidine kinase
MGTSSRPRRLEPGSTAAGAAGLILGLGVGLVVAAAITAARLRRRTALLESSMRRGDEVLATVSHELRTPLTSVVGFAHVLRDEGHDFTEAERREILGHIVDEAEATLTLVEDLLAGTDLIRSGSLHMSPRVIADVAATTREVIDRLTPLRGTVTTVVGTAELTCDEGRLRQILRNLLVNAAEHGEPPITVSISTDGTTARLVVSDDGKGIPEHVVRVMFDSGRSAPHLGGSARSSGIGLWLSRELARKMGGDLRYLGDDGGTAFELSLPVAGLE